MRFLTLYWWEWVAYAFGFSSIIINALWLLTTFRKKLMQNGEGGLTDNSENLEKPVISMPQTLPKGKVTVYIGLPLIGILLVTMGYLIRDHQLTVNTFVYEGVIVNSQVSDKQYWMTIPGYIRQRDFEFCHPLKMPAQVIDIKYEQKYGCKQVYGVGFVQPHKEKNSDTIQNGRNSTTPTETTAGLERER